MAATLASVTQIRPQAAPEDPAAILAALMVGHGLGLEWLPAIIATEPSVRGHEQGIRREHARLRARVS